MSRARYRMARNIKPGMEVRATDKESGRADWFPVTSVLTISTPALRSLYDQPRKITVLTLANGDQFSVPPTDDVMSR